MARNAGAPEGDTGGASGAGIAAPGGDLNRYDDVAAAMERQCPIAPRATPQLDNETRMSNCDMLRDHRHCCMPTCKQ